MKRQGESVCGGTEGEEVSRGTTGGEWVEGQRGESVFCLTSCL